MPESKEIARTSCEQTTAESGQMCRQNESSARAMLCSVGEHMAPRAPEIQILGWHGRWQAVLSVLHVLNMLNVLNLLNVLNVPNVLIES